MLVQAWASAGELFVLAVRYSPRSKVVKGGAVGQLGLPGRFVSIYRRRFGVLPLCFSSHDSFPVCLDFQGNFRTGFNNPYTPGTITTTIKIAASTQCTPDSLLNSGSPTTSAAITTKGSAISATITAMK